MPPNSESIEAIETNVAEACRQVLGGQLSRDQNFFLLGAASLSITRICSLVARQFNLDLPLAEVFANPSVADLAYHIHKTLISTQNRIASQDESHVTTTGFRSRVRPSINQRSRLSRDEGDKTRLGFRPLHHVVSTHVVAGTLELDHLKMAIQMTSDSHETLRTRFISESEAQVLSFPQVEIVERVINETEYTRSQAEREIIREIQYTPFDLSNRPPWRVGLIRTDTNRHIITFAFDHLIIDGWSVKIFEYEIASNYRRLVDGLPISQAYPPMSLSYYDYSDAVWSKLRAGEFRKALDDLRAKLDPNSPVPEMHFANEERIEERADLPGDTTSKIISANVATSLLNVATELSVSPFSCLLTSYAMALTRLSASGVVNGIVIPVANRTPETADLIGWFANMTFFPTLPVAGLTFWAAAQWVEREMTSTQRRALIPFAVLMDEFQPGRFTRGFQQPWAYFDQIDVGKVSDFNLAGTIVRDYGSGSTSPVVGYYLYASISANEGVSLRFDYSYKRLTRCAADQLLTSIEDLLIEAANAGPADIDEVILRNPRESCK
jgi:hypothetical protein